MDTGVYLVSYDGLLEKRQHTNCLFISLFVFILCNKKRKIKKNLADRVPACWVAFTLLRVQVFLLFLINIPTLESWLVYLIRHL